MLKRGKVRSACCIWALALVVCVAGCRGEGSQAILDLVPLQMQLAAEYGGSDVAIELEDGNRLGVTIVEDASGSHASDLGVERAREISEYVCTHYGAMGTIDTVEVTFESRRDGFFADATGRVAYAFARAEMACTER